jgi:hypothetical protein
MTKGLVSENHITMTYKIAVKFTTIGDSNPVASQPPMFVTLQSQPFRDMHLLTAELPEVRKTKRPKKPKIRSFLFFVIISYSHCIVCKFNFVFNFIFLEKIMSVIKYLS